MNTAEIKLDLFRKLDNLSPAELKRNYDKILAIIDASALYHLTRLERNAIEEALEESNKGNVYSHENVVEEARQKYPNLKFE